MAYRFKTTAFPFEAVAAPDVNVVTVEGVDATDAIQAAAAAALTAYDPPTNAEMEARTLLAANYATAANQTTIAGYLDTEIASILGYVDCLPATWVVPGTLTADQVRTELATELGRIDVAVSSRSNHGASDVAALVLATPENKLATNASGEVTPAEASKIGYSLSADGIAAILDVADGIESGITPRQALRAIAAALAGLLSGAGTAEVTIKAIGAAAGGPTRVTATVDADGNRTAITLNV